MNEYKCHKLLRMGVESLNFSDCPEQLQLRLKGETFKGRSMRLTYRIRKVGDQFDISQNKF